MVLSGQFLERPALVHVDGLVLEGLFHRGHRAPSLLICPDPAAGGMDAAPVAELAWAAARAGHASLRFQHRGAGASQGERDPARALDDARAAHRHLAESARREVAVAGVGAGCATAIALAAEQPGVGRVLLVDPRALPNVSSRAQVLALLPETGAALEAAALRSALGAAARVERIPQADAAFLAGLPALGRAAAAFLEAADPAA